MPSKKEKNSKKKSSLSVHAKSTNNKKVAKTKKSNTILYAVVVVILLAILAIVMVGRKSGGLRNIVGVESMEVLTQKTGVEIILPTNAKNVTYATKGDDIGVIEYDIANSAGKVVRYILMYSKDATDKLIYFKNESWSSPIEMNVTATDGKQILVSASRSQEDQKRMQGRWTDNEAFYTLATETLTTREDFLQEANRFVIANHKR